MNETISATAARVDELNLWLTLVCTLVVIIVVAAATFFIFKYHANKEVTRSHSTQHLPIEITWTVITSAVFIAFFFWGSNVYQEQVRPLNPDYEIFVFAKRWMWKFHHPTGVVEVNHLHLPTNKNIRLTMISEDVIHSFFVPPLRIKQDLLPAMITNINFNANKTGEVPLYCAEYCGTLHSRMGGKVTLLPEKDYRRLVHMPVDGESLAEKGEEIFKTHGCIDCHDKPGMAPVLRGLTDDLYIRDSILYPQRVISGNYPVVMPSFKDAFSEEELRFLIQYIKEAR